MKDAKLIPAETLMHQRRLQVMDMTLKKKINTKTEEAKRSRYGHWTDKGMAGRLSELTADVNEGLGEVGHEYILLMIWEEENIPKNRKGSLSILIL